MAWMGTVSYGMYLWHVPFRNLVDKWLGMPRGVLAFAALFLLTLAGGICLGALSWYLVERPAQAWARRRLRLGLGESTPAAGLAAAAQDG